MKRFVPYVVIAITTVLAVEGMAVAFLLWKQMRAGKRLMDGIYALVLMHPSQIVRHSYGGYDPVRTQFLLSGRTYHQLVANSWGFIGNTDHGKDPVIYPDKQAGRKRIVLLGGSSMVGAGASSNSQTIAAHLERLLISGGINAEVFNFGMFGDATYGELTRLIGEVAYLNPDVVIAMDGWNDAIYSLEWVRQKLPVPIINWHQLAYHHFDYFHGLSDLKRLPPYVFTYTWIALNEFLTAPAIDPEQRRLAYEQLPAFKLSAAQTTDDFRGYLVNISAMAAFCAAEGITFIHYLQPHPGGKRLTPEEQAKIDGDFERYAAEWGRQYERASFEKTLASAYEKFREHDSTLRLRHKNARFLDITDLFASTTKPIYADVIHYNDLGNRLIAERFARDLGFTGVVGTQP